MFKTISEAKTLASEIVEGVKGVEGAEIVICPPFTALSEVSKVIKNSNVILGAQNMHWEKEGAYTGEISRNFLFDIGCQYVIIGHSERRQYFGETNKTCNLKVKSALEFGLKPILCVGETLAERESGKTFEIVENHLKGGLKEIPPEKMKCVVIAYEPVWAIGTGKTATPEQAEEVQKYIRKLVAEIYSEKIAEEIRIQYGGSVKPENIKDLMAQPDIDGALVGGASLKAETFVKIVRFNL